MTSKHDLDHATVTRRVEPWWKWVVLVAMYLLSAIVAATVYSSGVMYVALLDRFGGDEVKTSLVVSLSPALLNLLAPIGSLVVNRFSCRVSVVTGGVFLTLAGFLSAFATSLDALLFTYGVLGGIGYALTYPVVAIALGFYFEKHRNLVLSLAVAVVGFGIFAAAPFTMKLLDTFALGGTFMIFGAISAQLCVFGVLCKPSPVEIRVQKKRFINKSAYSEKKDKGSCKYRFLKSLAVFKTGCDVSMLKMVPFVLLQLTNLTWSLMIFVCVVHLPNYATIHGATEGQITLLMLCFSISNTCGRFLAALTVTKGKLKDKSMFIQMCMLGIMGIVAILFPLYSHFEVAMYLFAVVTGLFTGGPNALLTPITITLVGLERLSNANGYNHFCCGIGVLLGPPIAGFLYGQTGSYKYSFIFGGCACLVGAALSLSVQILQKRKTKQGPYSRTLLSLKSRLKTQTQTQG